MRAFYAFAHQGFRQAAAYAFFNWMGLIGNFTFLLMFVAIWSVLLKDDPVARAQMMTYVLVTRFLRELNFLETWEINIRFQRGDVGLELIKPLPYPVRIASDFFGRSIFRALRTLPAFAILGPLIGVTWPSLNVLPAFLVSVLLSWAVNACIWLALALVALWTVQFEGHMFVDVLQALFSGEFLPFWYLPPAIAAIAPFTPFAGIYFTPAAIFSGALTGAQLLPALGMQALWAVIGVAGLAAMWRAGSRRLVMQGG